VVSDSAKYEVKQGMIETEIKKARKAKAEHAGERKEIQNATLVIFEIIISFTASRSIWN